MWLDQRSSLPFVPAVAMISIVATPAPACPWEILGGLSEKMISSMATSMRGAALGSEALLRHIFRGIEPSAVGDTSRDLIVVVSGSTLKTNSQKKSRYVTAAQVVIS